VTSSSKLSRIPSLVAVIALGAGLCGCGGGEGFSVSNINLPKFDARPLETNVPLSGAGPLRPVTPDQLVNADGSCAATEAAGGGIGLGMSECEVVSRAGAPSNVQIGISERQQRSVVLTYGSGTRPLIYRFVAGRLTVVEGTPEPPAPPKAAKQAKKKKKATPPS
jgi:hypothetical protein